MHNLRTKLENLKERWVGDLPEVLWAYRTTARSTNGETLFSLTYGYEAMVLVELNTSSLRMDNFSRTKYDLTKTRPRFPQRKMARLTTSGSSVSTVHSLILQLEDEDDEILRRRPRPQKSSAQQRGL